jgi:hypothetical protein
LRGFALDDENISASRRSKVIGDAGPDDSSSDNDYICSWHVDFAIWHDDPAFYRSGSVRSPNPQIVHFIKHTFVPEDIGWQ